MVKTTEIRPNLVMLSEEIEHGINLLLLRHGAQGLLVDTGFPKAASDLLACLSGLRISSIPAAIYTHLHWDHVGAPSAIASASVVYQPATESGGGDSRVRVVDAEHSFEFGGHSIRLYHRRGGHAPHNLVVYFEDMNVVHAGDLYFSQSYPVVARDEGCTVSDHLCHLRWFSSTFPPHHLVVSSHGRLTSISELNEYRLRVEESRAAIKQAAHEGLSAEEIDRSGILRPFSDLGRKLFFVTDRFWIDEVLAERA